MGWEWGQHPFYLHFELSLVKNYSVFSVDLMPMANCLNASEQFQVWLNGVGISLKKWTWLKSSDIIMPQHNGNIDKPVR